MNCGRVHQPFENSPDGVPFENPNGVKIVCQDHFLQIIQSSLMSGGFALERLFNKFTARVKHNGDFCTHFIFQNPTIPKVIIKPAIFFNMHTFDKPFIKSQHVTMQSVAAFFPLPKTANQSEQDHKCKTIHKTVHINFAKNIKIIEKEHNKNAFCLLWLLVYRRTLGLPSGASDRRYNILPLHSFCKKEMRAIPAGVKVEDLRAKNTPPANNSIRGRAVMCFYLLSVGLGMWVHIDLFLTRLGFCHTITSLLKTEARLGGSLNIHA